MTDATVTVPAWLLVALWSVTGAAVSGPLMRSALTTTLIGERTPGERLLKRSIWVRVPVVLLVFLACGPLVWIGFAWVGILEARDYIRKRWFGPEEER